VVPLGSSGKRIALVIGNDEYRAVPKLANAVHDAQAMRGALEGAGFQVQIATNVTREGIDAAVDKFIAAINPGDIALFYYSGHAVQVGGENYISPVDLVAANEVQVRNRSFKVSEVIEEMESRGADLQIAVLDACRNNPFARERSIGGGQGLAAMNVGRGTFLAYATAPGKTSDDNSSDRNGLYTTHLLKALAQPGLSLEQVFKQASADVQAASNGKQIPWISSSVQGDFYFRPPAPPPPPEVKPVQAAPQQNISAPDPAAEAWSIVKGRNNRAMLETIIREFPDSPYARLARVELAGLPTAPAPSNAGTPTNVSAPSNAGTPVNVSPPSNVTAAPPQIRPLNNNPGPEREADVMTARTPALKNPPPVSAPAAPKPLAPAIDLNAEAIPAFNARNYPKALPIFLAAANAGNAEGMYYAGYMAQHGLGRTVDYAEAMRRYKASAAEGHASAFSAIGLLYEKGLGVAADLTEARSWFQKGVEAGSASSMNELGFMYFTGLGVMKNAAEGCRWYRKSADAGFGSGMYNFGYCYETGEGVKADKTLAIVFYRKAAALGSQNAKDALQRLGTN
jgi:hypothetical protein